MYHLHETFRRSYFVYFLLICINFICSETELTLTLRQPSWNQSFHPNFNPSSIFISFFPSLFSHPQFSTCHKPSIAPFQYTSQHQFSIQFCVKRPSGHCLRRNNHHAAAAAKKKTFTIFRATLSGRVFPGPGGEAVPLME